MRRKATAALHVAATSEQPTDIYGSEPSLIDRKSWVEQSTRLQVLWYVAGKVSSRQERGAKPKKAILSIYFQRNLWIITELACSPSTSSHGTAESESLKHLCTGSSTRPQSFHLDQIARHSGPLATHIHLRLGDTARLVALGL